MVFPEPKPGPTPIQVKNPIFRLGEFVVTRGAFDALGFVEIQAALNRHASGDWGDVCEEDQMANEAALVSGHRLLSVYRGLEIPKFWIITEADRSVTTVLLPEEY